MATPLQYIPTRLARFIETDQPAAHCSLTQVKAALRGQNLDAFRGDDGSLTEFWNEVETLYIPETSAIVVKAIGQPLDWCRTIYFFDGTAGNALTLPTRYIYDVNLCYLRVIPSLPFYAFQRIRNVDTREFDRILAVEPQPDPPMIVPPQPITAQYSSSLIWTGIEDADLMVDTRARTLKIPPRVLVAGVGLPMANFSFIAGTKNIEVHYRFGFAPTTYTDGSPLQFANVVDSTGNYPVVNPKQGTGGNGEPAIGIDWSSGMPKNFSQGVARLVAARILRMKWRAASQGVSSMSIDGASESYSGGPFGGDIDAEERSIMASLYSFGKPMEI